MLSYIHVYRNSTFSPIWLTFTVIVYRFTNSQASLYNSLHLYKLLQHHTSFQILQIPRSNRLVITMHMLRDLHRVSFDSVTVVKVVHIVLRNSAMVYIVSLRKTTFWSSIWLFFSIWRQHSNCTTTRKSTINHNESNHSKLLHHHKRINSEPICQHKEIPCNDAAPVH